MTLKLNSDLCSGCRTCQLICALTHFKENNPKKSAIGIKGEFPIPGKYKILVCDQCGSCVDVCPTEAITEVDGVYKIDPERCTGCEVCIDQCPQQAMFMHKELMVPIKCDLCGECVQICPRGAVFSERWQSPVSTAGSG